MTAPARKPERWKRWVFWILIIVVLPLWSFGIYREHKTDSEGKDVVGRVVAGEWIGLKRPRFTVEFPTRKGMHRKEFGFSRDEGARITGGTDGFLNPEIKVRYHEDFPEDARLADNTPLPWWGGVIGMVITLSIAGFALSLPAKESKRR